MTYVERGRPCTPSLGHTAAKLLLPGVSLSSFCSLLRLTATIELGSGGGGSWTFQAQILGAAVIEGLTQRHSQAISQGRVQGGGSSWRG